MNAQTERLTLTGLAGAVEALRDAPAADAAYDALAAHYAGSPLVSVRRAGELSRPRPKHSNVPARRGSSTIVASGFMGAAKSGYVCPAEE